MRAIRIVDLDNTISQDDWRHWMIDPQAADGEHKYHEYHLHCIGDSVINRHFVFSLMYSGLAVRKNTSTGDSSTI